MFGIGGFELLIILVFGFILVGDRLPDVAKTLGRAIRTFQAAQRDMSKVIKEDVFDPEAEEPFKDPLAALDKMGGIAKKTSSSLAGDLSEMAAVASKKKQETETWVAGSPAAASSSGANATAQTPEATTTRHESADASKSADAEESIGAGERATLHTSDVPETFAERRARYEKERAARLAAKAQEAQAQEVQAQEAQAQEAQAQEAQAQEAQERGAQAAQTPQTVQAVQTTQGGE